MVDKEPFLKEFNMEVPVYSYKSEGMEIRVFKYENSPHDREVLSDRYYSGYEEVQIIYTKDHVLINPATYRFLFLRPLTSVEPRFEMDGDVSVFTVTADVMHIGFVHDVQYSLPVGGVLGADIITINSTECDHIRTETLVIRHSKGIIVPHNMECS